VPRRVVIVAIPGDFPAWLKIEHGTCGLLLLLVVLLVHAPPARRLRLAPRIA